MMKKNRIIVLAIATVVFTMVASSTVNAAINLNPLTSYKYGPTCDWDCYTGDQTLSGVSSGSTVKWDNTYENNDYSSRSVAIIWSGAASGQHYLTANARTNTLYTQNNVVVYPTSPNYNFYRHHKWIDGDLININIHLRP